MGNRPWKQEEIDYLTDKWGTVSLKAIAKTLGRTENAILCKKQKLGLGAFLESGEYISFKQLLDALGSQSGYNYKTTSWVKNRNFPLKTKVVNKNRFKVVYLEDFWKWAEKNRAFLDFSKMEENILGKEPEWVKTQRKLDYEKNQIIKITPWTYSEDERLKRYLKEFKYSYLELSKLLNRSVGAIQRRICDLKLKERPLKADNHKPWTDEEKKITIDMIKNGLDYEQISRIINRSSKAIRGRIYDWYGSERLDLVRERMTI